MKNPRATQDVLGFRQAYINLRLIPKSKIRKGAPMETMIGPQKIGTFVRSRRYPKMSKEGTNGGFKVTRQIEVNGDNFLPFFLRPEVPHISYRMNMSPPHPCISTDVFRVRSREIPAPPAELGCCGLKEQFTLTDMGVPQKLGKLLPRLY
jgi:hypothetical protein